MRLRAHPAAGLQGRRERAGRQVDLAPRADARRARGRREPDQRPARGRGRARAPRPRCARSAPRWSAARTAAGRSTAAASAASPSPTGVLDLGNSGTAARLLLGMLAGHPFTELHDRRRLAAAAGRWAGSIAAAARDGRARSSTRSGGRLPLAVTGRDELAADPLRAAGRLGAGQVGGAARRAQRRRAAPPWSSRSRRATTPSACSRHFGAEVDGASEPDGRRAITRRRPARARGRRPSRVPGDPSSAAFPLVAALPSPGLAACDRGRRAQPARAPACSTRLQRDGRRASRSATPRRAAASRSPTLEVARRAARRRRRAGRARAAR